MRLDKWQKGEVVNSKQGEEMLDKLEGVGQLVYEEEVVELYEEDTEATMKLTSTL